jgi:hypothetical protein
MKSTGPPAALQIWIGAEIEQHIHERDVTASGDCDERWRVEFENRVIDGCAELVVRLEQTSHALRIAVAHRFPERRNGELIHLGITNLKDRIVIQNRRLQQCYVQIDAFASAARSLHRASSTPTVTSQMHVARTPINANTAM